MNRLSTEQRARIIACLVEGNSIRATVRLTGAAKNTMVRRTLRPNSQRRSSPNAAGATRLE